MKPSTPWIIIIDNDDADNYIANRVIKKLLPQANVKIFTEAKKALEIITTEYAKPAANETILFLDINMPGMTGWEFLQNFDKLHESITNLFTIYMLTSSEDIHDKNKAVVNNKIAGYIQKPLGEIDLVSAVFDRLRKNLGN